MSSGDTFWAAKLIINFREKYSLAFSTDTILSAITFKSEKLVSSAIFPFINITASSSIKFSYFSKQSEKAMTSTVPPKQSISKNAIARFLLSYFFVIFVTIPPTVTISFFLSIRSSEKSTDVNSSISSACSNSGCPDTYIPSTSFSKDNDFFSSHSSISFSSGVFIKELLSSPTENKST